MRKLTFLFALLCASMMSWATQYCGETSSNANFTFSLTNVSGNTYRIQFDAIGGADEKITSINLVNIGVNQSAGAGIAFPASEWVVTPDRAYVDFTTASESSVPTNFYTWAIFFGRVGGGENVINSGTPTDVDWTATCSGGGSGLINPELSINSAAETLDASTSATFQIIANQSGDGAISYESSNSGIASVNNTGLVTAVGRGTATITISTAETATYAASSKTLTVTVTGPINWAGIDWLAGSNDKYKLSVSPEISDTYGGKHVQGGTDLWIGFPSAAFGAMSITPSGGVDAAWRTFALSNFPNQENQFTVECGGTTYTFDVFYVDGTTGGSAPEPTEIYDTNFALVSLGASATSDNGGTANNAIDNNDGTSWESTHGIDAVKLTIDLGQKRIFNTVQIRWEGAYGKAFTIDVSNDNDTWTTVKTVDETLSGFPHEQTLEFEKTTAQYIRFNGTQRGTGWGYNMFSFRVLLPGVSVLTSIDLTSPATIAQISGAGVALTVTPKDQNGQNMVAELNWEITPAAAGHMSGSTYIPDQAGNATIRAYSGEVYSPAVSIIGVASANLALSTNIATDNKIVAQSAVDPNGSQYDAFYAVDGNLGSVWQGRPDGISGGDDAARTFDSWFVVDLGAFYNIDLVALHFEGACSELYHIDFSANNTDWNLGYNLVGAGGINARNDYWTELDNNTKVRYVRFWSTKAATEWGMKLYEFEVYGTEWSSGDEEKPVMVSASLVSSTINSAVIAVSATDNDEVARYHVVDNANGIDANFTPSEGKITINGLTHATDYNFTITAKDASNNESANSIIVPVTTPFDGTIDLAIYKTAEAGCSLNEANDASKANDGLNTLWQTGDNADYANQWWYVDLGNTYNIDKITIRFENARSNHFLLQGRTSAPNADQKADDGAWNTLYEVTSEPQGDYALNEYNIAGKVARYVRFKSLSNTYNNQWGCKIRELCVYGSGIAEVDTEKPVMSSASLVSNTDSHAVIAVAATDNVGVAKFHVVDAGNSFDANFVAEGGNITVTGLTGGTNYNFTITAIDFFGNESANSKSVEVTTDAHFTEPQAACPAPTWNAELVKAIYSPTYSANCNLGEWGSGTIVEDTGFGKKYTVGPNGDNGYFGLVDFAINALTMEKLHFDIWVADNTSVRFVPIWGGAEQGIARNLIGQQWNSIDIELSEYTNVSDWSNIIQVKFDQMQHGIVLWVANAYFYRESAIVDNADPVIVSASVTEESFTSVKITVQATDDSGAVNFSVKNGDTEVATAAAASGEEKVITVNNLASGTHFNLTVIASDEAGNETSSSPLSATTKLLPPPAPVPTEQSADVKSLFSDVYSPIVAVENYCEWWWESPTVHTDLSVGAGDNVLYYDNNHQAGASFGWAWNAANKVDFGGFQMLHISIYPTQAGTIEIYPVVAGVTTNKISQALVANKWNEVVLNYTDKEFAPMNQIGFINFYALGSFFIDNVYFAKSPDLSRDASTGDDWMAPGELGTICIPNGAIAKGGDIYELVGKNSEGKIVFATVPNNEMTPGKPYLFEAKSNAMNFYFTDAAPAAAPDNSGAMKGTFNEVTLTGDQLTNVYYFAGHALWSCVDLTETGLHVSANRAYVKLDEVSDVSSMSPAPGRRYITMGVNGKNTATGIGNVQGDKVQSTKVLIDGQFFILRGEKLYDATGRLVK